MGCCIIWGQNWSLERKRTNYCCFPITVLILWGRINEINILHSNLHDDGSYTKEINAEGTEYPKKHACECFFTYMLVNRALRIEKWHILACPKCHIITNKGCTWLEIYSQFLSLKEVPRKNELEICTLWEYIISGK